LEEFGKQVSHGDVFNKVILISLITSPNWPLFRNKFIHINLHVTVFVRFNVHVVLQLI
jgi:hypothetical protein